MGKGGYNGGSTILNAWSDWFTDGGSRKKRATLPSAKGIVTLSAAEKEAELQFKIKLAAERLAQTQADFDAGRLKPRPPKPSPQKLGKKKRKKLKSAAKRAKKRAAK